MKQKKKGLAIFLIIWGAIATLIGALFVILSLIMILDGNDLISTSIVVLIFVLITYIAGILPFIKGIHILQGKKKKKHSTPKQTIQSMQAEEKRSVVQQTMQSAYTETNATKQILCRDEQFDKGD